MNSFKTYIRHYHLFVIMPFLLLSCQKERLNNCFTSTGNEIIEERYFSDFQDIYLESRMEVELVQDTFYKVEIIGGENILSGIKVRKDENELRLSSNNSCNFLRDLSKDVLVKISSPKFKRIENNSGGNIFSKKTITADTLDLIINSSGNITLFTDAQHIFVRMENIGDVELNGKVIVSEIYNNGNGFYKAENLQSAFTYITTNSTGDSFLNAEIEMGYKIAGVGNIFYRGTNNFLFKEIKEGYKVGSFYRLD